MSSLPAISDEDGAIAMLQAFFPGVGVRRLKAVLHKTKSGSAAGLKRTRSDTTKHTSSVTSPDGYTGTRSQIVR